MNHALVNLNYDKNIEMKSLNYDIKSRNWHTKANNNSYYDIKVKNAKNVQE